MTDQQNLYQLVDSTIKEGIDDNRFSTLIQIVNNSPEQKSANSLFDLSPNTQYVLRRFINACTSTNPQIRAHSFQALQKFVENRQITPNIQKLINFIINASAYSQGTKKNQSEAYAAGRILILKALVEFVMNNLQVFQSVRQVMSDFKNLQKQAIQVLFLISNNKVLKVKFQTLSPTNKSSRFLYNLFLKIKDPKSESINIQNFQQVLQIQTQQYPKSSVVLYNFGKYLGIVTNRPSQFFRNYANKFLDNDSENQVDIHEIYSILTVLKGFLDNNVITKQNHQTHFDKKIIAVWLEQFRVLNKKLKNKAKQIKIKFEQNNPEFAYHVLVEMHEQGIYLDNISANHPLGVLYQYVDVQKYWNYLYNICLLEDLSPTKQAKPLKLQKGQQKKQSKSKKSKQKKSEIKLKKQKEIAQQNQIQPKSQQQQQQPKNYYNQLQYLIKLRFQQIPDQYLCKTIIFLLNNYEKNGKKKQILFLCINLFNIICKIKKPKKKISAESQSVRLIKKPLLILSKLQLQEVSYISSQNPERLNQLKKCIIWLKKNIMRIKKQSKQNTPKPEIDFFNFYSCVLFYCLIYPEQIEICFELQLAYNDLITLYTGNAEQKIDKGPKKKIKRQNKEIEQKNKPIHVLNDIFISLMTKPPTFLRKSIHYLFDNIIPFLDQTDIANMITVITTPDAQFIEEI